VDKNGVLVRFHSNSNMPDTEPCLSSSFLNKREGKTNVGRTATKKQKKEENYEDSVVCDFFFLMI